MHVKMFDPGNFTPHYVENLSQALAALGLQVDLITSSPLFEQPSHLDSICAENHFFKITGGAASGLLRRHAKIRRTLRALSYPAGLWRTWRALKPQSPGIFHVQWALIPMLDDLLIRKLRSKGWRVVYTAHDVETELDRPFRRRLFRRIYRRVDAVIVHSEALSQKLHDDSGDVLRQIVTIPEGASTFPFSPDLDPNVARRTLGLEFAGPLLLFFGMIKPYKGLEYLLRAWPRVIAEFPHARLLIAGEAMVPMRPLHRLIDTLGIRHSVELRLGYVPRSEAQYFFCAADAVVLPYVRISTSGVVPLAYRYARPVIATSAGALPEIVKDGETGFLVPPRAEEALADAICRGFRNPERLANMGARARDWFEKERGWDKVACQTEALYRSLLPELTTQRIQPSSACVDATIRRCN
ncbi:MAG: glycosyltransferase family 4 protein [Bryobacteraceae bacterium]